MLDERKPIPEPLKRAVRQHDGFGCCVCGYPFCEYHHIVPRSEEPGDLMLLCPNHHAAVTSGAIPVEAQRKFKATPHNIARGHATGLLTVPDSALEIELGGVLINGEGAGLVVDGVPLLLIHVREDGGIEITARLFDPITNELILHIERNEWRTETNLPWDLVARHQRIILRQRLGRIALRLDARHSPIRVGGTLWHNGVCFRLRRDGLGFGASSDALRIQGLRFNSLCLQADTERNTIQFGPLPKLLNMSSQLNPTLLTKHEDQVFQDQAVFLTGHAYIRCTFIRCTVVFNGLPILLDSSSFESCNWRLDCMVLWGDPSTHASVREIIEMIEPVEKPKDDSH